jgi:hypothetical protein
MNLSLYIVIMPLKKKWSQIHKFKKKTLDAITF